VFTDYFGSLATAPTAIDGHTNYGPLIAVGIPAGGLFTGAEEIKTAAEAAVYGGTAGEPCYHRACDTIASFNGPVLDQMSDAIAHSTLQLAMTTSAINGTGKASAKPNADKLHSSGPRLRKQRLGVGRHAALHPVGPIRSRPTAVGPTTA